MTASTSVMKAVVWFLISMTAIAVNGPEEVSDPTVRNHASDGSSTQCPSQSSSQTHDIPELFNIVGWGFFLVMQLSPAKSNGVFRSGPLVHFPRKRTSYEMKICQRAAVKSCMFSGALYSDDVLPDC